MTKEEMFDGFHEPELSILAMIEKVCPSAIVPNSHRRVLAERLAEMFRKATVEVKCNPNLIYRLNQ